MREIESYAGKNVVCVFKLNYDLKWFDVQKGSEFSLYITSDGRAYKTLQYEMFYHSIDDRVYDVTSKMREIIEASSCERAFAVEPGQQIERNSHRGTELCTILNVDGLYADVLYTTSESLHTTNANVFGVIDCIIQHSRQKRQNPVKRYIEYVYPELEVRVSNKNSVSSIKIGTYFVPLPTFKNHSKFSDRPMCVGILDRDRKNVRIHYYTKKSYDKILSNSSVLRVVKPENFKRKIISYESDWCDVDVNLQENVINHSYFGKQYCCHDLHPTLIKSRFVKKAVYDALDSVLSGNQHE